MLRSLRKFLFHALGIFLVGLFFSVGHAEACTVGGEVGLSNPLNGDTLCMGAEAQLFLSGYEGEILRWERSTNNGNTWQPISRTERTYVTEPLFETTLFRAVVKKGNCEEKFSKVRKVVLFNYKPRLRTETNVIEACGHDSTFNVYFPYNWPLRNFYNDLILFKSENETQWNETRLSPFTIPSPPGERGCNIFYNIYTHGPGINEVKIQVCIKVRTPCGFIHTDTITVTCRFIPIIPKSDFELSGESICFDKDFTVKSKTDKIFYWQGINVVYNLDHDKLPFPLYLTPIENNMQYSYFLSGYGQSTPSNQLTFYASEANVRDDWRENYWADELSEGDFLDNYKDKNDLSEIKVKFYGYYYQYICDNDNAVQFTDIFEIPVSMPTVGGRIKSSQYYCVNGVPAKLTLTDHRGKVLFWESSVDGMNWTRIPHTDTTYLPVNLTQTTYFRAQVQNGNCSVQPSKFARITFNPQTKAGILVGKNSRCPLDETPTITLRGQVGQVDHWEISYNGTTWENVPNIATNFKPDTVLRDTWVRAVVISPGCNPETTDAHKITYLSALMFDVPKIKAPAWVCDKDQFINLELPVDASMVVDWEVNDCCNRPAFWEKVSQAGGKNTLRYAFVKNCITGCCYGSTTYWFRVRLRYSMLCNDVYTLVVPVSVYCCPTEIKCTGGRLCREGKCLDVTNPRECPNPWLCVGEQVSLFPSPEGLPYFDRWEYAELTHNEQNLIWIRVPNSEPDYVSHQLSVNTCFRSVSVINGREFPGERFCVRVLPNTRPGYVTKNRTVCKGENSDTLRVNDWLGEIKIWQSSTDSTNWTDIIHSDSIYQSLGLQQTTWFRSVVRLCNAKCALDYSKPVKITVLPFDSTKGGVAFARFDSVCVGGKPKINLNGEVGGVIFWQETTPEDTLFNNARRINVFAPELEADPITSAKIYRACVKNSDCETKFSKHVLVKVGNPRAFAEFEGVRETCPGGKTTLYIKKRKGDIVRWEYQDNNVWTAIENKKDTLLTPQLARDTRFRVVLKIGGCNEINSQEIIVTTTGQTLGGTVKEDKSACITRDYNSQLVYPSATFELKEHRGNILFWETSENNGQTWAKVEITTPTLELNNIQRTTKIRATVAFPGCTTLKSLVATFTIKPEAQAGTISVKDRQVCANGKTELRLQNYSGQIIRWEYNNSYDFTNPRVINSTDAVIETPAIVDNYNYFRAVLRGDCGEVFTQIVSVERLNITTAQPGTISVKDLQVCANGKTELRLQNYSGQIIRWEYNNSYDFTNPRVINSTDAVIETPAIVDYITNFRAVLRGECGEIFTPIVSVIRLTTSGYVSGSEAGCTGKTTKLKVSNYLGRIDRWESSPANGNVWTPITQTGDQITTSALTADTKFRVVLQIPTCDPVYSNEFTVKVIAQLKGGIISPAVKDGCIAYQGYTDYETFTLTDHEGSIKYWQISTDNGTTWKRSNGYGTTYYFTTERTTWLRAVVQAEGCDSVFSAIAKFNVTPYVKIGNLQASDYAVCKSTPFPIALDVSGSDNSIIRWEKTTDANCYSGWTTITHTLSGYLVDNLQQTTCFRAVAGSACATLNSNFVKINVMEQAEAGNITLSKALVCADDFIIMTLSNYKGNILGWQISTDGRTWREVNRSNGNLSLNPKVTQNTRFRVKVGMEGCGEVFSEPVFIEVRPKVNTGTLIAPTSICRGEKVVIKLTGNNRRIIGWQEFGTSDQPAMVYIKDSTINFTLYNTRSYRAVLEGCMPNETTYTETIKITVNPCFVCKAPLNFRMVENRGTRVRLAWSQNFVGAQNELSYRSFGASQWTVLPLTAEQSIEISGLTSCTNYEARIRSIANGTFSEYSSVITFQPVTQPNAPTASQVTQTNAMIQWNGTASVYQIRYRVRGTTNWTTSSVIINQTSRLVIGLKNRTTYEVQVRAACSENQPFPDWNENTVIFTTGQTIALCTERKPSAPSNVTVSNVKNNKATVRWTNIADSRGTAVIYGLSSVSPSRWTQVLLCSPNDSLVMTGLQANKQYRVRVRTLCEQCTQHGGTDKKSDWVNIPDFKTLNGKEESVFETDEAQVQVYPNPNNGNFRLSLPENYSENTVHLQLLDLSGRLVWFNEQVFTPTLSIQPENISAGTYVLQVRSGSFVHHLRIIVE